MTPSTAANISGVFRAPMQPLAARSTYRRRAAKPRTIVPTQQKEQTDARIIEHLGQVQIIARKIRERLPAYVDLDDLIGYGTVGLMKAVKAFDPSRGAQLRTYAEHRIRGAILDGLRGMNW